MSQTETLKNPAVGLDVGTSRIVTARNVGPDIKYDLQLNAFVTIPYSKMTEAVLQKENVPHSVDANEIIVHGNESERFADLLNKDIRRPMTQGVPESRRTGKREAHSRNQQPLSLERRLKGAKLYFSVPAAPLGAEENLTYHEATIKQFVTELGYEAKSINEGLAVVYGELESSNYTGIGISCGGGLCNVCLAYLSVPVMSFSIPKGGDFIDSSAASVTGERANRMRILKEQSFHINGHFNDKFQQVLNVYYDDMIHSLVGSLRTAFQGARNLPKMTKPVPLVLSGGTAMPKGFRDRFEKILREKDFPIELSEIRMAAEPLTTTAKGALVAALCDMK